MKVAIIGAGPAGMTAAYELSKSNVEVEVFEASDSVGGLSKTIELWNQKVDLGPHRFFSNDRKINELWLEVAGSDYEMVNRLTRIYYKKKFYYYPLKPFDALSKLGFFQSAMCVFSYFAERISPTKETSTFESWVVSRFGRRLFNIFFKTYSEKLWGISCSELDSDFAAQRIKKLSLFAAIINAFTGGKGNKHKTLVDEFAYPKHGTGMIYERMKDFVLKKGGLVSLNTPFQRVLTENGVANAIELKDGSIKKFDQIISTMPLSLMVDRLPEVPSDIKNKANSLKFRNTILVYLRVEGKDLFPDNWLYVHSTELQTGRISNFSNWVPEINNNQKDTILVLEYWCYDQDKLWTNTDEENIAMAKKELELTGLNKGAKITDGYVYKIKRCYPVYETGYKERLKPVEQYLSTIKNLHVIGRYGSFKYNNQDHSILMGLLAAEKITKNIDHNLWEINTDYEEYQESAVITKTGLKTE